MDASSTVTDLADLYRDLHRHPELSFQETRTGGIVAERLRAVGCATTEGVGGTGVVGVLRNGSGPVALLRADMDALRSSKTRAWTTPAARAALIPTATRYPLPTPAATICTSAASSGRSPS